MSKSQLLRRKRAIRRERREAKRLGISHRAYVKRRTAKERHRQATLERILREQGEEALMKHLFRTGQLY